jgi:hypothetical protein
LIRQRQNRTLDFGRINRQVSLWTNKKVTAELRKSVTLVAVSILHRLKKKPMFLRFKSRGIERLLGKRNVEKTLNWGNAVLLFSATRFSFIPMIYHIPLPQPTTAMLNDTFKLTGN